MHKEYRAFIPRNPHDSWSQDTYTVPSKSLDELKAWLDRHHNSLPNPTTPVIYEREVSNWKKI